MNNIFVKCALIAVILVPGFAEAGPIVRSGKTVSIDASQVLKGDFYGFAPTVTISGAAENDVYVGGGTVTLNAPVTNDVTIVGGVVQIHGDVGDDLRVIGGEVTLAKAVKGDVVVYGGTLTILSTASVEGDVLFMGGDLNIEGPVVGGVHGNVESIRLNSEVGGDVTMEVKNAFVVGDKANILGSVQYEASNDMVRAQDAVIVGDVSKVDAVSEDGMAAFKHVLFQGIVMLFSVLIVYLTLRKYVTHVVTVSVQTPGVMGLVGIAAFLLIPFVGVLLILSVLGSFIGIILCAAYIIFSIFAALGSSVLLGLYVQKIITKKSEITLTTLILGVVSFFLLTYVPVLGAFIIFGLALIMFGGIMLSLYTAIRM